MTVNVKVVNKEVDFNAIVAHVEKIAEASFSNGIYHAYLRDFAIACTVLKLFTDYSGKYDFNEVMHFYISDKWDSLVKEIGGNIVDAIEYYVEEEIYKEKNTFAELNGVCKAVQTFVGNLNNLLVNEIDASKIMNFVQNLDVDAVNKFAKLIGGEKK